MIIHDKAISVTTNVLYQVFSPYGDIEKIARFQTRGDFHALVNLYSHKDAVYAFCELQGHQIYDPCCELDLYFASEFIIFVVVSHIFHPIYRIINFLELL